MLDGVRLTVLGVLLGIGLTTGLAVGFGVGGWAGAIWGVISAIAVVGLIVFLFRWPLTHNLLAWIADWVIRR